MLKEGIYSDITKQALPIVKKYKDYMMDLEEKKKEVCKELLTHNKELQEQIDICMVDIEEFLLKSCHIDFDTYDAFRDYEFLSKYSYKLLGTDIRLFEDMIHKLNDIIGDDGYEVCWSDSQIYSISAYNSVDIETLKKDYSNISVYCCFIFYYITRY